MINHSNSDTSFSNYNIAIVVIILLLEALIIEMYLVLYTQRSMAMEQARYDSIGGPHDARTISSGSK